MAENPLATTFRAILDALNRVATRKDSRSRNRSRLLEGHAAQIEPALHDQENKGRPRQVPPK
jgi:hypothetical protein